MNRILTCFLVLLTTGLIAQNKVGINTDSPLFDLDVRGTDDTNDGGELQLGTPGMTNYLRFFGGRLGDPHPFIAFNDNDYFHIVTASPDWLTYARRVTFAPNGNVGIGIETPLARLHVEDSCVVFTGPEDLPFPPGVLPIAGPGTRMLWYPDKAAFRVGRVEGTSWDQDSIGPYSFASGLNSKAKGVAAFVGGGQTNAAVGSSSSVSGGNANTTASSSAFIGGGISNIVSGSQGAIGAGFSNAITATQAFIGAGLDNEASGAQAFVGAGFGNIASGSRSFTGAGSGLLARSHAETVFGTYSTDYSPVSTTTFVASDRLFVIGNGTAPANRKNAVTVLKSGRVGLGTETPLATFQVQDSSVLFRGPSILPVEATPPPVSGTGNRMMWYADKAAFRAGYTLGTSWNKDSIGLYSFAAGYNNKAKGLATFVGAGTANSATGSLSVVLGGDANAATSYTSVAAGGANNIASGNASFTGAGIHLRARSYAECVVGLYNTEYTAVSTFQYVPADRLFVIGNGTSTGARSNAMTVLKNGRIGIGTDQPKARLHVIDSSVVFSRAVSLPSDPAHPPISGAGIRMIWYADKGAFRAGQVVGTNWDRDSIGNLSAVFGADSKAKGLHSFVGGGLQNTATGGNSFVGGGNANKAQGSHSFVGGGISNTAEKIRSFVGGGIGNRAQADCSFVGGGTSNRAKSFCEAVFGMNNTDYTAMSETQYHGSDRIFVVGNGFNSDNRSNALTILKNGNTGVGNDSPAARLHVQANSTTSYAHLTLTETSADDYARIKMENANETGIFWDIAGRADASAGDSRLNFYYSNGASTGDKMTIVGNGNVGIGTTTPGFLLEVDGTAGKPAGGSWTASSDVRLKQDIHPYTSGLEAVMQIRPVTYRYNTLSGYDTHITYTGVIAQELQLVAPEMVSTSNKKMADGSMGYLTVDNSAMTYMLINAVKELSAKNEELNATSASQEQRIEALESEIAAMNKLLQSLISSSGLTEKQ